MKTLVQLFASVAISLPVFTIFALAANSQEITPQIQPNCSLVVCTTDGVGQPEQEPVIILPPPYIGQDQD